MVIARWDARKSQSEEVELKWWKGFLFHKRSMAHNNVKSKYLILEQKVRSKSELHDNVKESAPIPSVLTYKLIVCRIDAVKVTDLVGESLQLRKLSKRN